jgi:hypothetical protein
MSEAITAIGTHPAIVAGDCLELRWTGTLVESDIRALFTTAYEIMARQGRFFLLLDATRGTDVKPAARKHILSYSKEPPFTGTAIYGAPFQTRVMVNMIVNAVNMFRTEKFAVLVCDEEARARAWIDERRGEWLASRGATAG